MVPAPASAGLRSSPAAQEGSASLAVSNAKAEASLAPAPAIFAIPTHATTHVLAAGEDDAELSDEEVLAQGPSRMFGRPAPSPQTSSYSSVPQHVVAGTTPGPFAVHGEAIEGRGYAQPTGGDGVAANSTWRTAHSILVQHTERPQEDYRVTEAGPSNPRMLAANPSARDAGPENGVNPFKPMASPPPRYRRGRFFPGRGEIVNHAGPHHRHVQGDGIEDGGRFPRWRDWLEKRAQERHAGVGRGGSGGRPSSSKLADVRRKKSWGAAVDGSDAVSEMDQGENGTFEPPRFASPLHLHTFGSRFISHLPATPLCAAILELAPSATSTAARLLQRTVPETRKRRVLLIGTAMGLHAVEFRRDCVTSKQDDLYSSGEGHADHIAPSKVGAWNRNIRSVQVWTGVGVYQMSVLAPQSGQEPENKSSLSAFGSRAAQPAESGILLALCSSKGLSAKHAAVFGTASVSAPPFHDINTQISGASLRDVNAPLSGTEQFGNEAGGGIGRALPPSSSGNVRMWSLEAVRRMVAHVLDSPHHEPLDLQSRRSKAAARAHGRFDFTRRIRKVWATFSDASASAEKESVPHIEYSRCKRESLNLQSRQSAQMDFPGADSAVHRDAAGIRMPSRSKSEDVISRSDTPNSEFGHADTATESYHDANHEEALRLAQGWVPIMLPGSLPNVGQGESVSSLFSDESPTSGGHGPATLPSASVGAPHGKGVLFYALTQAHVDGTHPGNWYLVLAQTKSLLLFESLKPATKGDARSWNFLKELYTPLPPKGVAFCYSTSGDMEDYDRRSMSSHGLSVSRNASVRKSSAKNMAQATVRSSPYSSVFRDESSLHLFVSFGRKAVMIRASDGQVKDVEPPTPGQTFPHTSVDSESLHPEGPGPFAKSSYGYGQAHAPSSSISRRSLTVDAFDGGSASDMWNGFDVVRAEVNIRCIDHANQSEGAARPEIGHEDDEEEWESDDGITMPTRSFTLRDVPSTFPRPALLQRNRHTHVPSHNVIAILAIVSRGKDAFVVPSPLPRDTLASKSLCVMSWTAVPTAISASARVVGLERGLSSGPVPVDALGRSRKRQSSMLDPNNGEPESVSTSAKQSSKLASEAIFHIDVSIMAFLPSRIELKQERVRLPVRLPFAYGRDSELEIEPVQKAATPYVAGPLPVRSTSLTSETPLRSESSAMPPEPQHDGDCDNGVDDDAQSEDAGHTAQAEEELEYLCGMLHGVPQDESALRPWDAAGDGGAWAFDWRGANDFRIFYAGAHV